MAAGLKLPKRPHDWLGLVLTAVCSIAATMAVMRSDTLNFETAHQASIIENQTVLYQRIGALEKQIEILFRERAEDRAEIATLKMRLSSQPDPLRAIYSYLNAVESPAWLKMWYPQEKQFRMLYINEAYERQFNVTKERYIGLTDFDIHPEYMAKEYEANDRRVLRHKNFIRFDEQAPIVHRDGSVAYRPAQFWKFYVRLPDGREVIAGTQVRFLDEQ